MSTKNTEKKLDSIHLDDYSTGTDDHELNTIFRPIFSEIAKGSLEREQSGTLPFEQIKQLKKAKFGALRVPKSHGGFGASIPQLFRLLTELAEADSNITQALRGHFAFVEDRLNTPPSPWRDEWFRRFSAGDIAGNGWTEVGDVKIGQQKTRVTENNGKWLLTGEKFYSTGSIFADWVDVTAQTSDDPESLVTVAVSTHQDGVKLEDNWDGFGQKTTGSGRTVFTNAVVDQSDILPFAKRFKYQTAFYQLVLLSTLSGIGRAALKDLVDEVRKRTRIYSHGNANSVREDAQIQQVVGSIAARVYTAENLTIHTAQSSQDAYLEHSNPDESIVDAVNITAEIESAKAQIIVSELILKATADLFNALGASAASTTKALDRHWRNARTVSSHNPLIYKEKMIGAWELNSTEPVYQWQIGQGK